ncbi:MAG TPA: flagellar basal body P-ring formation chaperone FlgA [Vicinamibacterales bacterium]
MPAALLLLGVLASAPAAPVDASLEARAADAIRRAVAARLQVAGVTVEDLQVSAVPSEGRLMARPAPDVRTGAPGRFALTALTPDGPRRVGSAQAVVQVEAVALRTLRDIPRGRVLTGEDVAPRHVRLEGVPLQPLPAAAEVLGATARRALPAGTVVTADAVRLVPLVQSGQPVTVSAVVGAVVARGRAIAVQNGRAGDVVVVVNPETRRRLRARVTGPGEVEVMHGS